MAEGSGGRELGVPMLAGFTQKFAALPVIADFIPAMQQLANGRNDMHGRLAVQCTTVSQHMHNMQAARCVLLTTKQHGR